LPIAAARIADVASASEPWIWSSTTWTALSAPIWQRLLQRVRGLLGADRQHGHLTLAGLRDEQRLLDRVLVELREQPVDTHPVGVLSLSTKVRSAWASGTYLTQTTMFMRPLLRRG
jgi:hypothetical protein